LREKRALRKEIKFKYELKAENITGEIYLEDLSAKTFMQTARKQFNYAAIEAEENGFEIEKRTLSSKKLDIYQLQLKKNDEFKLEYYLNQKNEQKMLKLSFEIGSSNRIQLRQEIEDLINSLNFK
jgi:hypothetical protein